MAMELTDLLVGFIPGIIIGAVIVFVLARPGKKPVALSQIPERLPSLRTIAKEELDIARSEYKTLRLEKDLLAGALVRVFEAESHGKLSKAERELLTSKYREQIKQVDAKIADSEILVEVGELENLKDELLNLLETKVSQIERRLTDAQTRLAQIKGPPPVIIEEAKTPQQEEKKAEKPKPVKKEPTVDEKVKDIRNEVLEALARLEQMDVEG
ncbi:MAG: hypothetical protein HYU02_01975 [Thaumarchaeota archaeon]|nr:hypothetical protein [Nitrososphaerota archaeon]